MMAAHQADAAVAAQTPDQALQAAIAQSRPDLWAPLSTNPAAYPDLLGWLASTGNVEVLANLRARGYLTDDAAANAADAAGAAGTAGAADGDPAAEPAVAQDVAAQTKSAEPAGGSATPVNEDEAETAEESEPVEESDAESSESSESSENVETTEIADDGEAEVAEADEGVQAAESAAEAAAETDAEAQTAQDAADGAQEPGSEEPDDEAGDELGTDPAAEPTAEPSVEPAELDEAADVDDDSGETSDEQETTEEPAEPAEGTEGAVVAESAGEGIAESADADESAEGAESAAEAAAETDAEAQTAQDAADGAQEPGSEEPDDEAAGADDVAVPADEEPKADESTEAEDVEPVEPVNDDTTALSPASQWHEVDSADTADVMASAQSEAAATGWTAGSAESVALPVPPPPSAEDIAAWAETPSGAPSGFSAAQPAVELDMFGPRMVAQMPPPQQQKRSSSSSTGRLVAIIVVLLLVIAGGGGVWAGNYFASKDKGGDSSRDRADTNGDEGGQQNNGQADAAATSTAAALPSGAVKACSSMPTFTITSVEDGQGELKVHGNMATSCAEGDFLAGSSSQVLVYSSTSPTGGADVDHLVASGTFDLSSDPLIIPNGGRAVTLRFGEQHYFRTAKDLDLKGLTVRPSFDRGSSSTATAKSSTNSAMTIASSASSNANQEAQDEQAAGDAIQWQIKHDYPIVMNSLRGKWTPQLSSKQVGLVADGQTWTKRAILAEYLKTQQANPKAVIIDTSQWPVYDTGGWWVTLQGDTYSDGDQANAWCDAQGYDSDHCLAKRIESNGTSQGTTKLR